MIDQSARVAAVVTTEPAAPGLVADLLRFRKKLFIDDLGWALPVADGDRERDQFDGEDTVHVALLQGGAVVGGFRAIRCDRPYLSRDVFPQLATERPYPTAPTSWEISRFGVLPGASEAVARLNYALMFQFAAARRARALVALADLAYERFLLRQGIRTTRYGAPEVIGADAVGRPLLAVAGEITLSDQRGPRFDRLLSLAETLEVADDTLVF